MIATGLALWATSPITVPDDVRAAALRHLLDGVGTAIGGVRSGTAQPAVDVAIGLGGPGEATVLGTATRVSAPAAALANGTLVHALDFDDTHAGGLVHATAVVLPAAFAVGQQVGASGRQVLEAAVVGYEAVTRIASAAPHGFHARGLHATAVAGVFSSALVAARLCGLDAATAAHALGIAGSQAGGLLAFLGTGATTKQLHPGLASQSGIIAARLAAAGATGPEWVFEGRNGLYEALATGEVDTTVVLAGLGETWETTRIGIKPYPACQLSHATLDAVRDARAIRGFTADEVVSIDAVVHPDSAPTVCPDDRDLAHPSSGYAAKFSLPWSVAALVVDGELGVAQFEPDSVARPDVADLATRVHWTLAGTGHAADAPGSVRVTLSDGTVVEGAVERSAGGPSDPLTDDQLVAKFNGNAGPGADQVVELVRALDALDSLEPLLDAIAAVPPSPTGAPA
ncbi:MAG TPA: MmgE/PrpD family protein [Marmoricola sp.]|jgi:2-methylcitrate dehydratase PrpD|nr:MmgE/PrpD family protein [Marmoricola sp.]